MRTLSIYLLTPLLAAVLILFPFTLQAKEYNNYSDSVITKEVQQKISDNLFYTVFDWVTVSTHDGNVTLHGYVHLPWDKAFFVKIAKEVKGVTSVTDKIKKITGLESLRHKAAEVIYSSPEFERYAFMKDPPVHIIVIGDKVILKGSVASDVEKGWADLLVQWHTNAFTIKNDLSIQNS